MSHRLVFLAVLVAVLTWTPLAPRAQEPGEPRETDLVEEVEVRYVILDALVLDSNRRVVSDLTRDDFELYVDWKPHPIATVDVDCPAGATEDPQPVRFGESRAAVVPPGEHGRVVLTVDYRHLPQTRRFEVLEHLEAMVRDSEAPGEELMVAAITNRLRVEQPFTTDRAVVLETLARMKNDPGLWQQPVDADPGRHGFDPAQLHKLGFFKALLSLIELLERYEGTKTIVLFSDQPSTARWDPQHNARTGARFSGDVGERDFFHDPEFEIVSSAAARARTTIYPVHARGLTTAPSSTLLARLAVDTGGRFTENTNDLSLAYARAQRDQSCRYAIGFHDERPDPARVRRASLDVKRPGVRVHHASYYRFGSAEDVRESLARTAYDAPRAFESDTVRGRVLAIRPISANKWRAAIEMRFTVGVPEAGPRDLAFGARVENDLGSVAHQVERMLTVQPHDRRAEQPIVVVEAADLAPGSYLLSIVVDDPATESPATAVLPVELPALPAKGVVVGQPILLREARLGVVVHEGEGVDLLLDQGYEPLAPDDPVLSGEVTALTQVCRLGRARRENAASVQRVLGRGDGTILSRETSRLQFPERARVRCETIKETFSTSKLDPAAYRYDVMPSTEGSQGHRGASASFSFERLAEPEQVATAEIASVSTVEVRSATTKIAWPEVPPRPSEPAAPADRPSLEVILDRLAQVADVYSGNALEFTAEEITRVYNYLGAPGTPRKMRVENLYSYYRDEQGVLHDRRIRKSVARGLEQAETMDEVILIADAAGDPMSEWIGLKGGHEVPAYLERPYSWVLLFSRESQERYDYRIEEADAPGRIRVRFEPKGAPVEADWFGVALIDLADLQIMRAEGLQATDHAARQAMERMLASEEHAPPEIDDRTFVVRRVSSDFAVREQGLRFPSRVEVTIERHRVSGAAGSKVLKTETAAEIVQTYARYQFFDVDFATEYRWNAGSGND